MALVPVYFDIDGETVKALVLDDKIDFFLNLGSKRTPLEVDQARKTPEEDEKRVFNVEPKQEPVEKEILKPANEIKKASPGDKGSGKPNSFKFHKLKVLELKTFDEIQDYAFKVTNRMIRKSKDNDIGKYQTNALRLIKEHIKV